MRGLFQNKSRLFWLPDHVLLCCSSVSFVELVTIENGSALLYCTRSLILFLIAHYLFFLLLVRSLPPPCLRAAFSHPDWTSPDTSIVSALDPFFSPHLSLSRLRIYISYHNPIDNPSGSPSSVIPSPPRRAFCNTSHGDASGTLPQPRLFFSSQPAPTFFLFLLSPPLLRFAASHVSTPTPPQHIAYSLGVA